MHFIGIDLGSSSVKVSVLDATSGACLASAVSPAGEMAIDAVKPGWAEQDPEQWYLNMKLALTRCLSAAPVRKERIGGMGVAYQMHGLVALDSRGNPVRPAIIWCDSRAVEMGKTAEAEIGKDYCLSALLNSPGNFTASKLAWVKKFEPEVYSQIKTVMLPGDYLVMRLTGEASTTVTGLSEGILWDFERGEVSSRLLEYYGFSKDMIPPIVPGFGIQGRLSGRAAEELGLIKGTPVTYRAGDQPNNAFSLRVLDPGDIAATAGTSGVLYAVSDSPVSDPLNRINTFAHVNHSVDLNRLGVLACVNGAGILNSWTRKLFAADIDFDDMNRLAEGIGPGSEGLSILPFGNGAERLLGNQDTGAAVEGLNLNIHTREHFFRAVQEGVAYAFRYAMDVFGELGISPAVIRAGHTNMFLSPLFTSLIASLTGTTVTLYNTDGSLGAARGASVGAGFHQGFDDAFTKLDAVKTVEPDAKYSAIYDELYNKWKQNLGERLINI